MKKVLFFVFFSILIAGIFITSYSLTKVISYTYKYNHYSHIEGDVVGYVVIDNKKTMLVIYKIDDQEYKVNTELDDVDKYPIGSKFLVRYDEKNPNNYILGNEEQDFKSVIIGCVLLVAGIGGMVATYGEFEKLRENNKINNEVNE